MPQEPARSINRDASATFPSLEQPRLPPGRPTGVSTSGESRVAGLFLTQPGRGTCFAGYVRGACGAGTAHVKPPQPRHTSCAPHQHPNMPGARPPRARTSQRKTLEVHRRGRCRGACGAGQGYHLPSRIRRHVQLSRFRSLQTRRGGAGRSSVKNLARMWL